MNKKRMMLNLIGQLSSFVCSLGISFVLTPYIVDKLGQETYGFVGLANNFTSYISLFTVALNGMLARYVTVEYSKKDYKSASGYLSTAVIAQGILAVILLVPMLLLAGNMEKFFNISPDIVPDVRILWVLIFVAFLASLPLGGYGTATFATNRLEVASLINIISNVVRAGVLCITFVFYTPHVWYIGFATILSNTVNILLNYYSKKKYMPEVDVSKEFFNPKYIVDLLLVGVWNSLNRLQQILHNGLDLLITNLFIDGTEMGLLSIAKNVPNQISGLIGTVSGTFDPAMTILYGKGDNKGFIKTTKFAMRFSGFLCSIPILGFICFGVPFYQLWMPSLTEAEILKIQICAVLTLLPQVFSVYIFPLYTVNTITAKLKLPVIVSLVIGFVKIGIVYILLKTTELGIYAVVGVSAILWVLRVIFFVPIYAAWVLKFNWWVFYEPLLRGIVNIIITGGFMLLVSNIVDIKSWIALIVICGSTGVIGYLICFFIMFPKEDRSEAIEALKNKFMKRRNKS